jgi:multicomponent Na+:H+ antiporter subunit E
VIRFLRFVGWYAAELARSYVRMTADIAGLRGVTPALVRLDTHCTREVEIGLLGVLISLSPGTIVVDTRAQSPDAGADCPWTLYVHGIHEADPERLRRTLRALEYRMLEAFGHRDLPDLPDLADRPDRQLGEAS